MKCNLRDITLNYEVRGEGRPLLLLHGFPTDHRAMVGMIEPIFAHRNGWKSIYLDLPGMGQSQGADWIVSSEDMIEVIIDFTDQVIHSERFSIAGQSYGGYLAQGLLYKRPELVDGLLLVVPSTKPNVDKTEYGVPDPMILYDEPDSLADVQPEVLEQIGDMLDLLVIRTPEIVQRTLNEIIAGVMIGDQEFLRRFRMSESYRFPFDVHELPQIFERPMLALCGRQDSVVGFPDVKKMLMSYARGSVVVLDRSGHNLPMEQEKLFHALVNEWLDRVEEAVLEFIV
jgi:pimeloyl-ACP methyl ester carboxylesterase